MPRRRHKGMLTDDDMHLFNEGTHHGLHDKLGSHPREVDGRSGTAFAVWAPNAERVAVIGDFNDWNPERHPLRMRQVSGVWEGFVPDVGHGAVYKYSIRSRTSGIHVAKADPFARRHETPPRTASVVWESRHAWGDGDWMKGRGARSALDAPISIYELHLGSWRPGGGDHRWLNYRELAPLLAEHALDMGFTHVELLPVMEHPFYGSWGYQVTGYFAPTSRYGSPDDLMYLIDYLHQHGLGVVLDWVPSHFPTDEHGLGFFDGTHLFEHADPRQGFHPDWKSYIFNLGRHEVRSFLLSSAIFWLKEMHADGLRVDAVASMLYLDYSRQPGEWVPNAHGGRENLHAIELLRALNLAVETEAPGARTFAEESTSWPMVSRPAWVGGLGFSYKWDMGWMHDTLAYLSEDPIHRRYHHGRMTFRQMYSHSESFMLPLSHDEVVHGKRSLLGRMWGDEWQRFANLRLLFGWMFAQPGKKLLFMGGEIAVWREWDHEATLEWSLTQYPYHVGVQRWVRDLNHLYRREPALHRLDCDDAGFVWIDANDAEQSVFSFQRLGGGEAVVVAVNATPVPRDVYRLGGPGPGRLRLLLDSDHPSYGGSGYAKRTVYEAEPIGCHGRTWSLQVLLPPLAVVLWKWEPYQGHEGS